MTEPRVQSRSDEEPDQLPALVRSRVAFARRGLSSVRLLQGLCCGAGAAALSLACGVRSGAELSHSGLQLCALANGLLVWLACMMAIRLEPGRVVRQMDEALELEGELVTAWEFEGREEPTDLARLLGRRVASRVPAGNMLRAVMPNMALYLALPFLSLVVLFAALEQVRQAPETRNLANLTRQLEQGLAAITELGSAEAADGAAALTPQDQQELRSLMGEAADLGKRVRKGEATPEELETLGERLSELQGALQGAEGLDLELKRAMSTVDTARMALESQGAEEAGRTSSTDPSVDGNSSSGGRGLAPGDGNGRMARPEIQPAGQSTASEGSREEVGVLGRPSWPAAHENIVRRWVELSSLSRPPR